MPANLLALVSLLIATAPSVPAERPWAPTRDMVLWSSHFVPESGSLQRRAEALHRALVSRRGLGISQDLAVSLTAQEAFDARRADCVGFGYLYLGLARSLGLPAYFVRGEEQWPAGRLAGARVMESHLAVGLWDGYDALVVDHGGVRPHDGFRPLDDDEAEAILWSNRGVRGLMADDCPGAVSSLRRAVRLTDDPDIARNLAVVSARCESAVTTTSAR